MAIEITYTDDGLGVELISSGVVTGQDIIEALKQIYGDERFGKLQYLIADKTGCTEYEVETDDVRTIASMDAESSKLNPDLVEAHIAPLDIQFGVSRIWHAYVSQTRPKSNIFRDRETALEWVKRHMGSELR